MKPEGKRKQRWVRRRGKGEEGKKGEENYRREGEQKEREVSEGENEENDSIFLYLLVLSGSLIDSLAPPTLLVNMGPLHSVC